MKEFFMRRKRLLSVLLTVVMLLSLMPAMLVTAGAEESDYVKKTGASNPDAEKYTAVFAGISGKDAVQVTPGKVNKPAAEPVRDGYVFVGWTTDTDNSYPYLFNFDLTEWSVIDGDTVFRPVWVSKDTKPADFSGKVLNSEGNPVTDAWILAYGANGSLGNTACDENGCFTFKNLPEGEYNIVISDYENQKLYTAYFSAPEDNNRTFSISEYDTTIVKFSVGEFSRQIVVDGLEQLAEDESIDGRSVVVGMSFFDSYYDIDTKQLKKIKACAGDKKLTYIEMQLSKSVNDSEDEIDLSQIDKTLTLVMPLDKSKEGLELYRYNEKTRKAELLVKDESETDNPSDGHYYVNEEKGLIYYYTNQSGFFAIGYDRDCDYYDVNGYRLAVEKTGSGTVKIETSECEEGTKVQLNITPDAGFYIKSIDITDEDGWFVFFDEEKRQRAYSFIMPENNVDADIEIIDENLMPYYFEDVKATDYFYDAVVWAYDNDITSGADLLHFNPSGTTTRAQMVTFLWREAGCPEPSSLSGFEDVKAGSYYEKAVAWAVEKGITEGMSKTEFAPNSYVTRAQAVTFLWRMKGSPEYDADEEYCQNQFTDVSEADYYFQPVMWALDYGITEGTGASTFSPGKACTRAQVVTFMYRDYY